MAGESGGGWAGPELTAPLNPIDEIKGALGVLGAEVLTRAEARAPRRTGALASCGRLVAGEGGAVGVSFAAWYARIAESHRKYLNPAGAAVLSEARTKREAAEAFKRSMRTWAANLRRATT